MKHFTTPGTDNKPANGLPDKWLDKQDILQLMNISSSTLLKWRRKKLLPHSRIGRKIYYRESDLLAMLEKNRQ